ncbi:sex-determining region Y protein-like [Pollicipes pollicipes]|uniref:sex-determining region Y protein-like n=1 Tax=Pollicipes pollicipes TaxID=41117 RepID=UPI0018853F6F|nr:sex-determining region Y protein-like [Pollicipes pollicipes]
MAISLNEFSIRYPEFPKYIWDSPTPYSDTMRSKKDRRNPEHTKRPLNAFMLFAKIQRESITANFSCNHSEISKALGRLWQELSKEEKEPFMRGAKTLVELHRLEYPDYKYRPRKKGQPKEAARPSVARKTACRRERQLASSPEPVVGSVGRPASPLEQLYLGGGGSPAPLGAPDSPLSSCYGAGSLGQASPASGLHTPYSPVPSVGSSSGYESELSYRTAPELPAMLEEPFYALSPPDCFSPEPEPEMRFDLSDLEVTPLDETTLLNPLAMFPVLDLTSDDLDDLRFGL